MESKLFRCCFVHSPAPSYADTNFTGAQYAPLWAFTLAAYIPQGEGYSTSLYDTRFTPCESIPEAELFLFSGLDQDYETILGTRLELANKYPSAVFAIGGPICNSFDQGGKIDELSAFDHIFTGDGEEVIKDLLEAVRHNDRLDHLVRVQKRFTFSTAKPPSESLLKKDIEKYYGGMIEVSRGCPFLCEFCDVRTYPDNNRPHNKDPKTIVKEVERYAQFGVSRILLVCDNFIGDLRWAELVADELIEFQKSSSFKVSFFTESTTNLYKYPGLMRKLRAAGFDMLHIGVESFSNSALLETAKVQNTKASIAHVIQTIQSFGFVVAPGLIFGFDSDLEDCFDLTLDGLVDAGLMAGDPSLLIAIPGTPLYHRMKLAGRLRDINYGMGFRYQTNIKYIQSAKFLISGMVRFFHKQSDGHYQYLRLKNFCSIIQQGNYVPIPGKSYIDIRKFAAIIFSDPSAFRTYLSRIGRFLLKPTNIFYLFRGLLLVSRAKGIRGRLSYFFFWLFFWTNMSQKSLGLSESDFDIESIGRQATPNDVLPDGYEQSTTEAEKSIPQVKVSAQRRHTIKHLKSLGEDLYIAY